MSWWDAATRGDAKAAGIAINIRYLRTAGLSPAAATTSVAVCQVVNSFSYCVLLIGFAVASRTNGAPRLPRLGAVVQLDKAIEIGADGRRSPVSSVSPATIG